MARQVSNLWDWLWVLARGFLIGAADLVPGISGGTVALVTGIYERLITALRRLQWGFLLTIAVGVLLAFALLSQLIHHLLNTTPAVTYLYAAFFGFVLGAIYFLLRQVKGWGVATVVALAVGIAAGYALSALGEWRGGERYTAPLTLPDVAHLDRAANYNLATEEISGLTRDELAALQLQRQVAPTALVTVESDGQQVEAQEVAPASLIGGFQISVFGAGLVAACAMLLPGVSGAYLLETLGFYTRYIGNIALFASGQWDAGAAIFLVTLGLGILVGLLTFSQLIGFLLHRYRNLTLAALIGLMIGALRAVWPWWNMQWILDPLQLSEGLRLEQLEPTWPTADSWPVWVWMLGAFAIVFALEGIARGRK